MAASDFSRVLRGRPSLRRSLKGLGAERLGGIEDQLSDLDPVRFKSLYRQRLGEFAQNEALAQPGNDRAEIERQLTKPGLASTDRDVLNERLRKAPGGFGSVAQRDDPNRYGSIASRSMPSLYRGR